MWSYSMIGVLLSSIYMPLSTTGKMLISLESMNSGYVVSNGVGAYKVHHDHLPWNEAKKVCVEEGGNLAVIQSGFEHFIVDSMMNDTLIDRAWIGIYGKHNELRSVPNGSNFNIFATWEAPVWFTEYLYNNELLYGPDLCALQSHGGLMLVPCIYAAPFICKINI